MTYVAVFSVLALLVLLLSIVAQLEDAVFAGPKTPPTAEDSSPD